MDLHFDTNVYKTLIVMSYQRTVRLPFMGFKKTGTKGVLFSFFLLPIVSDSISFIKYY